MDSEVWRKAWPKHRKGGVSNARSTPSTIAAKTGGRREPGKLLRLFSGEPDFMHPGGSARLAQTVKMVSYLSLRFIHTLATCCCSSSLLEVESTSPHIWLLQSAGISKYHTSKYDWKSCFLVLRVLGQPFEQALGDQKDKRPHGAESRCSAYRQNETKCLRPVSKPTYQPTAEQNSHRTTCQPQSVEISRNAGQQRPDEAPSDPQKCQFNNCAVLLSHLVLLFCCWHCYNHR